MGVKDSGDLAWQDWVGTAGFDRGIDDPEGQDHWACKWAEGRALRRTRGRARRFGAALPRHVGTGGHGHLRARSHGPVGTHSTGVRARCSSLWGVEPSRAPRNGLSLQLPTTMRLAEWRVAASIRA